MKKTLTDTFVLMVKGGAIGIANIIPGVSGGTVAVILGVYDRLIGAIAGFFSDPAGRGAHFLFLLKISAGAACAVLLLANLMDILLKDYFRATMFLFMGLILGGVPAVVALHKDMAVKTSRILAFVLGMTIVLALSLLKGGVSSAGAMPGELHAAAGYRHYIGVAGAGFLAGGTMIIPGISGSFILVLVGQYSAVIEALKHLDVRFLAFLALGAGSGIIVFSSIINLCLKKIPSLTYYFILGLIFASLYKIFPGMPAGGADIALCTGTFIAGSAGSYVLSKVSVK